MGKGGPFDSHENNLLFAEKKLVAPVTKELPHKKHSNILMTEDDVSFHVCLRFRFDFYSQLFCCRPFVRY